MKRSFNVATPRCQSSSNTEISFDIMFHATAGAFFFSQSLLKVDQKPASVSTSLHDMVTNSQRETSKYIFIKYFSNCY